MTNRLLTTLVVFTAVLQLVILYRQPRPPALPPRLSDAPKGFYVDLGDFPARGSRDARTVIVEFSDYECPFCARHATTVLPELIATFVESGRLRYLLANNPLPMHANARRLAAVAMCAGEQGKYWEMHDLLFASKPEARSVTTTLVEHARLDGSTLQDCLVQRTAEHERVIKRDQELARKLDLLATPAFAIGRIDGSRMHVLKLIRGAVPVEVFREALTDVMAREPERRAT